MPGGSKEGGEDNRVHPAPAPTRSPPKRSVKHGSGGARLSFVALVVSRADRDPLHVGGLRVHFKRGQVPQREATARQLSEVTREGTRVTAHVDQDGRGILDQRFAKSAVQPAARGIDQDEIGAFEEAGLGRTPVDVRELKSSTELDGRGGLLHRDHPLEAGGEKASQVATSCEELEGQTAP